MKRIYVTVLVLMCMLSGCLYPKETPAATGLYEPVYIAEANVPLAWMVSPGHFDRVTELERDSYGRVYYSYRPPSAINNSGVDIHIISQGSKDGYVLYYPDICYMIRLEEGAPFTQAQIDHLKLLNDWDIPIKEEKTYRVSSVEGQKDIAYEEDICEAIRYHLKLNDSYVVAHNGLEYKNSHEQLLFVSVYYGGENEKQVGKQTYYLMSYCDTVYRPIVMSQQVEDPMDMQEQIIAFRAEWMSQ